MAYELEARLDPARHSLEATASLELENLEPTTSHDRFAIELKLHPDLEVESVETTGAGLRSIRRRLAPSEGDETTTPAVHRLIVESPAQRIRIKLDYSGRLNQDVAAGERKGEIHNFAMSAHIGEDGIYLEPSGWWYPRLDAPDDADPDHGLADYRLAVDPVEGFELVAGLESDRSGDDGRLRWRSPFPVEGLVLLGGPLARWSGRHGDVALHAVLDPGKAEVARDLLAAAAEILDRYEKLIGPYPYREFTVLEAFFSSGFAFPTCTQIAGSQLSERRQYRRHGYLDHELLHNWWGNGVLVDPRDGNWCEGLTSYLTNYYGHVLDGDEAGARKQRRNQSNFLSEIDSEDDLPLGTFGLEDGAGRGIGYQKSSAVFHMLERKIGSDALFRGLRRLSRDRLGRYAAWDDLKDAFASESELDLDRFFEQWIRRGGAPRLQLESAAWTPGSNAVTLTITQDGDFVLDVPLRLFYEDQVEDVEVHVEGPTTTAAVPVKPARLLAVELDPDYHVFRKLGPDEAMPTSRLTHRGPKLLVVLPDGELAEGYGEVVDSYRQSILGDDDEPAQDNELIEVVPGQLNGSELRGADVLVLGDAVRHGTLSQFLARTRSPVSWTPDGFVIDGESYDDPGHAVLFTVHHPDREGGGVTVYYGNSRAALANAGWLGFYANSLLVFDTPVVEDAEPDPTKTRVVLRRDFEFHDRIDF